MPWNAILNSGRVIQEWHRKRKLRELLRDRRSATGVRSIGQREKGIAADRVTTERLLLAIGARKSESSEHWTLAPLERA